MTPNSPKSAEVAADKDSNDNDRNKDRNKVIQRPGVMARAVGKPILWYQKARAGSVSPCRHTPSCSTYALEAVETHGAAKGLYLGFRRVLRCNPWGTSGYDPVPERKAN